MNKYQKAFPKKNVFLPVIHTKDLGMSLDNAKMVIDNGADGMFLINWGINALSLIPIFHQIRKELPNAWIGVNLLGASLNQLFEYGIESADGIWVDDAGIRLDWNNVPDKLLKFNEQREKWNGLYFGGVAFKHTLGYTDDPETSAKLARASVPFMDVVTTSGPGTNFRPSPEKPQAMKKALGDFPLANASGVGVESVHNYLDFVDCFLVASKISIDEYNLDPKLTKQLAELIHNTA